MLADPQLTPLTDEALLHVIEVDDLAGQRTANEDGTPLSGMLDFNGGRIYVEKRHHERTDARRGP